MSSAVFLPIENISSAWKHKVLPYAYSREQRFQECFCSNMYLMDFIYWSHCSSLLLRPSGSLNSLDIQDSTRKRWSSLVDIDAEFQHLAIS